MNQGTQRDVKAVMYGYTLMEAMLTTLFYLDEQL